MRKAIKRFLFKILGIENYLKLLNKGFFFFYHAGLLKFADGYRYHYFVKNLIKPGDTVVDIGANLGYFTKLFSKWTGNKGSVIAIEPVPLYNKIIRWAVGRRDRKSTRLNSSHSQISYAVFCLKKKKKKKKNIIK